MTIYMLYLQKTGGSGILQAKTYSEQRVVERENVNLVLARKPSICVGKTNGNKQTQVLDR